MPCRRIYRDDRSKSGKSSFLYSGLEIRVQSLSLENSETSNFRHLIVNEGTSFGDVARDEDVLTRCNIRRNF